MTWLISDTDLEVTATDSSDFIADLSRAVRRNIGLPEEITEPPPEQEPKGKKARREFRRQKKLAKLAPPSPQQIASSLVQRNESRLTSVTAQHEKELYGLELPTKEEMMGTVSKEDDYGTGTNCTNFYNFIKKLIYFIMNENNCQIAFYASRRCRWLQ